MSAAVLPFPLARRADLVRRQAAWFVEQGHRAAEVNLSRQLDNQRDCLVRKGVSLRTAVAEVRRLESAIRSEVWRLTLAPECGA